MFGAPNLMRRPGHAVARLLMLLAVLVAAVPRPAFAQDHGPVILRDSETEAFLKDLTRPLILAAGLDPRNVQIVIVGDPEVNAFTAGGQVVYINSGLFTLADNANEIQGVVAHELGHIAGGHSLRIGDGVRQATAIMILSMLLGAAAAAAGAGDAGMAAMMAGQQAAQSHFLAFTRDQESSADQAGATFLARAGISGRGSLAFFRKMLNMEYRMNIPQEDAYDRTHPLDADRIATLESRYQADPAWNRPTDPQLEERFQRVRAKLMGYVDDPQRVLARYPESNQSIPAHYARTFAYHRTGHPDEANAEADALLRARPHDPYFLEVKGQILLEGGHPQEALPVLREAVSIVPDQPMIEALLGHALIATEDPANFEEAKRVLRASVARDNDNPFAWYQLGIVYDREGDEARAALATAERYNLEGNAAAALPHAERAMMGIPVGSADWLRAQDIAMVARNAAAQRHHH